MIAFNDTEKHSRAARSLVRALRSRLKPRTVLAVALPFVIMPVLTALLGEDVMWSVMIYSTPLMVFPLLLRLIVKFKR